MGVINQKKNWIIKLSYRRLLLSTCLFLIIVPISVVAQNPQEITGTVFLSNKSESLAGTSVNIKDTTQFDKGLNTDSSGQFRIQSSLPVTLVFSRVGYTSKEITVNSYSPVRVTLKESAATGLNDVVVVSYGMQKARNITSAVTKFNAAEARNIAGPEFGQKLQGRVAGLQIGQASGRPGHGVDFRVRGAASLSSGYQPLIVVDGQPLSGANSRNGDMNLINPDDVETFTVLKDAAAAALYGSRAANGVILITTKQAKPGQTSISLNVYTGWQKVPEKGRPNMMNAKEFATFMKGYYEDKRKYEKDTSSIPAEYANPEQYGEGTNWYNALLRTAPMQNYSLNISSGGEKVLSSTTFSYFTQDGVLLNTNMRRFSFRTNNEYRPFEKIKLGANIAPTYQLDKNTRAFVDGNRQILANATAASPLAPIYNEDGSYNSKAYSYKMLRINNPVQQMALLNHNVKTLRLLGNIYAEIELLKGLKFKTSLNTDIGSGETNFYQGTLFGIGLDVPDIPRSPASSTAMHASYNYISWLNENMLTYDLTVNKHNLNFLAGYASQKWSRDFRNIEGSNFAGDGIPWISGASVTKGSNDREEWSLASALGRFSYNYDEKYLLTATIRRDGSSRFGEYKKYGVFPSVSAGWIVSAEPFFPENKIVNFFKIRGSWGKTGNFNIPYYLQVSSLSPTNYVFGGSLSPGFSITSLGNKLLTWEVSTQADFGLDINLFNNRVMLGYDYYNKITEGMLYPVSIPSSSGYKNIRQNVGKFKFWGHEFQISSRNLTGPLEWNTDFNISFNDNKVIALPPNTPFIGGGATYSGYNRTVVGRRVGEFYGYVFDGIYNMTEAEFASPTVPKHATSTIGSVKMKDINGDDKITPDDRTFIGNPTPKFIFGIANTFNYKNFDLNIVGSGQYGGQIMMTGRADQTNLDGVVNVSRDMMNNWRSVENPGNGSVPRTRSNTTELYRLANSSWVFDASYFTIKNIALGYTFKSDMIKYIRSARIYASVQQVAVFTKYKGQNPEANAVIDDAIMNYGQDLSSFPIPRTFMIGLNLNF